MALWNESCRPDLTAIVYELCWPTKSLQISPKACIPYWLLKYVKNDSSYIFYMLNRNRLLMLISRKDEILAWRHKFRLAFLNVS